MIDPTTKKLPDSYLEWRARLQKRQEQTPFTTLCPEGNWYYLWYKGIGEHLLFHPFQALHREGEWLYFYDPIARKTIVRHQCEVGVKLTRVEVFKLVNDDYRK